MPRHYLSPKQKLFVNEFLVDMSGAAAARRAGYSEKSAASQAARLLALAPVQRALDEAAAERAERSRIAADELDDELAQVAFARMTDFELDDEGNVRVKPGAPKGFIAAVKAVHVHIERDFDGKERARTVRFQLHDKVRALELAMRRRGLLREKVEVSHKGGVTVFVPHNFREKLDNLPTEAQLELNVSTREKRH